MGPAAVQAAVCGWAEAIITTARETGVPLIPGGTWGFTVANGHTGEQVSSDVLDAPVRDAMRIISCYGNGDYDMIAAIINAGGLDAGSLAVLMIAILHTVSGAIWGSVRGPAS